MLQKALAPQHLFFFFSYAPSRGPYTWSEWIDPRSEPGPLAGRRAAVSLTRVRPPCSGIRANLSLHQMPPFSFDRAGGACRGDRTAAAPPPPNPARYATVS